MGAAATLAPGLLYWQARHPEWPGEEAGWGPKVTSYAVVDGEAPLLFDPLAPPAELATGLSVAIFTCPWHSRDALPLAQAGAELWAPAELLASVDVQLYRARVALPGGVEAYSTLYPDEYALWVPSHRALVFGESLYGVDGVRLPPPEWLPGGRTAEEVKDALAPLLDLEPEWFLPTHGEPAPNASRLLREALGR